MISFRQESDTLMQDSLAVIKQLQSAQLKEPEELVFHFDTIGWKILAVVLLGLIIVSVYYFIHRYKKNHYRRQAIATVLNIEDNNEFAFKLMLELKKTAIITFGRDKVAMLDGSRWLQFLDKTGDRVEFLKMEEAILNSYYTSRSLERSMSSKARDEAVKWLRTHGR
ncbi:hypothetical protein GCM10007049_38430 [Echinicola pacifica]|uniref:DUF4381 domain-containing protein n=1 Tax=Echinicola pacifica TaxID=346377 RepID=A0A918UY74_9BACT|nr:DUF4381 domain-containing protein [Echinicola pacifica]GGZ41453.1 hypothetical protein GCM10007049_38430 [Echinicola pacifica]